MKDRIAAAAVLDQMDVGVIVRDRTLAVLFANRKARTLLGASEGERLDADVFERCWQAISPDGTPLEPESHPAARALRTRQPVRDVILGFQHGTPECRWLQVTSVPTLDADGQVDKVYTTFTDVSRGQIQQNQLASTFEKTIRSMAEGVAIIAPDGWVESANPAAERILGLTLAQMQGRDPIDPGWRLLRPDGSPLPPAEIPSEHTRLTGQSCRDTQVIVRRANGERVWLSVSTDLLQGAAAAQPGVVATFTDITSFVRALESLEEHRALLRRVTDAVPGVLYRHVVMADGTDAFRFVSAQAREVMGVEASDLCASSDRFWSRVHPQDAACLRSAILDDAARLREAARRGVPAEQRFDEEFRIGMPDGAWRWLRAQSLGVLVGDTMVCHGLITDVTERRQLAEQLRVSQRQELIGVLVSGVAHNFNNMLAAIVPNLERASQHASGELAQEIADAYDASRSAADLVRTLMLLVRHDEPHASEPLDVVTLVQDVMRMCRRTFDRRIALETTAPTEPMVVMGRRSELQQVILNLCINARDAVESVDGPRITVDVQDVRGDQIAIAVRDTGIGMDEDTARRVGQPFFTTKAPGEGTGLGVATAAGIIRDMGGELTWTSQRGAGSTFRIVLPRAPAGPGVTAGVAPARRRFDGQLVLVVDDEPLVRKTLGRLLEGLGLTTLLATTGEEALDVVAERDDVSAVLLDLSMPGLSGAEVLTRLAALRPQLPVFVVSGWVAEPDALAAARGVIPKPFTASELADALAPVFGLPS
jgi:two-component system, cell cycle sensor histidine kinase and response regulator CckA